MRMLEAIPAVGGCAASVARGVMACWPDARGKDRQRLTSSDARSAPGSYALVTRSDALVPNSFLFLICS